MKRAKAIAKQLQIIAKRKLFPEPPPSYQERMANDYWFAQKELLSPRGAKVVFDVGAHKGRTAAKYRELFPQADIYAFEPFPDTYNTMSKALGDDRHFFPQQLAVSNAVGHTTLYVNSSEATNSLLAANRIGAKVDAMNIDQMTEQVEAIGVRTTTLDAFCAEKAIARIDVLKIDVQGASEQVLQGAQALLRNKAVGIVLIEVEFIPIYKDQKLFHHVAQQLEDLSYQLFNLYDSKHDEQGRLVWADALFMANSMS